MKRYTQNKQFIPSQNKLKGLVKKLGAKQTINPVRACSELNIYNKRMISHGLSKLYKQGILIKQGPGETYSLNPCPKISRHYHKKR